MANKIKLAGTTSNTFDVGLTGTGNIAAGNIDLTANANVGGWLDVTNEIHAATTVLTQNANTTGSPGLRITGNYTAGGSAGQFQTLSFNGSSASPSPLVDNDYTFQFQTLGYTGPSGAYEPLANYGFTGDFALHKTDSITSPVGFNYVGGYFQFVQFGNDGTNDNSYDYQLENGQLRIGGFSPTNGFGPAETNFTATVQDSSGTQYSYKFGSDGNITLPTNTSSINYANGSPYGAGGGANANYANFAGNVVNSAQSNITSLGSLTALDMAGNITMNGHQITNSGTISINVPNTDNFTSFGGTYTTHYGSATSFYRGNGTVGGSMNNIAVGDVIKNENYFVYADSGNTYLGVGQTYVDVAYNDGAGNVAIRTNMSAPIVDGVLGKNSVFNVLYEFSFLNNINGNVITGNLFNGNGSGLTSLTGANVTGAVAYATTANSVAVANVSGIGNIATVNLDGNSSNVLYGNGVFSSVPTSSYGNSNVATFLASYGSNTITTTGNVSVGNIIGNGQALTGLAGANVTGTVANATYATSAGSATTAGTVTTAAQPNITSTGTLTSLSVSGTATIGNLALTKFNETVVASANTSTSISPDLASGSIFAYTANNNFTFNGLTNAVAGSSAIVKITQDGTGNRLLTSTMKFAGGSKTLSTAASSVDIISVYYDGSTYYATLSKGYA